LVAFDPRLELEHETDKRGSIVFAAIFAPFYADAVPSGEKYCQSPASARLVYAGPKGRHSSKEGASGNVERRDATCVYKALDD
jgi:hypothetical protein